MAYIWQQPSWPAFRWESAALVSDLSALSMARGRLFARLESLGVETRTHLEADHFIADTEGTSVIEGEHLPPASVRSSVARRLGLASAGLAPPRRDVDGLVEVLVDATRGCEAPLTAERLFDWHAALFPTGRSGMQRIVVGAWRPTPISVRSGPAGSERTHYQAPPPEQVSDEMARFLAWWSAERPRLEGVLRAGLAHLWFESVHPFEDGNGRIGRALADMALAQADGLSIRAYSLSQQILLERPSYYRRLEEAQSGDLEVTPWLGWFVQCLGRAVQRADARIEIALRRAALRTLASEQHLNPRQIKVMEKLIAAEPEGFEGGLSNKKYRSMTRASKATATRDLADLVARGLLRQREGGGRSTRYVLNLDLLDQRARYS
jgi:Fic family protein